MPVPDPLATPARIAFAGDWHMNGTWAAAAIGHAADQGADVIVHLGDFGYTFDTTFLRTIQRALAEAEVPLLFVDGNHEDFDTLLRFPLRDNGLRQLTDNLWHLPRGFRWAWGGVRFLALGGAHSVDRRWRTPGRSWWEQETISDDDVSRAVAGGPVDVLVTHDCPVGVDIPGIAAGAYLWPPEELVLARAHRTVLRSVVDEVQPTWLWHGHYHLRYSTVTELGFGELRAVGLDCDATTMEANVALVELAQLQSRG